MAMKADVDKFMALQESRRRGSIGEDEYEAFKKDLREKVTKKSSDKNELESDMEDFADVLKAKGRSAEYVHDLATHLSWEAAAMLLSAEKRNRTNGNERGPRNTEGRPKAPQRSGQNRSGKLDEQGSAPLGSHQDRNEPCAWDIVDHDSDNEGLATDNDNEGGAHADVGEREEEREVQCCLSSLLQVKGAPRVDTIIPQARAAVPAPQGAISTQSLLSLEPSQWLDDDALNALIEYNVPEVSGICVFGSHTWSLLSDAQEDGRPLPKSMDLEKRQGIRRFALPVHLATGKHWLAVAIWLPQTSSGHAEVILYDPAGGCFASTEVEKHVKHTLQWWIVHHAGLAANIVMYTTGKPAQRDSFNCGVFVAMWILSVLSKHSAASAIEEPGWSPDDAEEFRAAGRRHLVQIGHERGVLPKVALERARRCQQWGKERTDKAEPTRQCQQRGEDRTRPNRTEPTDVFQHAGVTFKTENDAIQYVRGGENKYVFKQSWKWGRVPWAKYCCVSHVGCNREYRLLYYEDHVGLQVKGLHTLDHRRTQSDRGIDQRLRRRLHDMWGGGKRPEQALNELTSEYMSTTLKHRLPSLEQVRLSFKFTQCMVTCKIALCSLPAMAPNRFKICGTHFGSVSIARGSQPARSFECIHTSSSP